MRIEEGVFGLVCLPSTGLDGSQGWKTKCTLLLMIHDLFTT